MASGPRSDFTWMERCLRSRDFDVGIESNEASNSAVNLSQVEIIRDLCFKDDFQVLGQATKKRTLYHYHHHLDTVSPVTPLARSVLVKVMVTVNTAWERLDWLFMLVAATVRYLLPSFISFSIS